MFDAEILFNTNRQVKLKWLKFEIMIFIKLRNYDITIIGGGIVGLATARKLITDNPNLKFILVEKENQLGILLDYY